MLKTDHQKIVRSIYRDHREEIKGLKHVHQGQLEELQHVIECHERGLAEQDRLLIFQERLLKNIAAGLGISYGELEKKYRPNMDDQS
jgi:formylmethanofuran dehydrogenase subunit C